MAECLGLFGQEGLGKYAEESILHTAVTGLVETLTTDKDPFVR